MDLSKVVKIGIIAGISIIAIIATTNMLFPSNAINLHEQACMSLANQMIENMEESNFDTEKFAKMNDLLFSRMTNEQCTDTEGWKNVQDSTSNVTVRFNNLSKAVTVTSCIRRWDIINSWNNHCCDRNSNVGTI